MIFSNGSLGLILSDASLVEAMSPERLDTEIPVGSGAKDGRSLRVIMSSSYSCRHCDADGHHTTVNMSSDTVIWIVLETLCVLAGGGLN